MLYSRDDVVLALCNSATSTFAGFVIFFYLESLANILGLPVDDVAESGPSLAFIVYPYAVTKLPAVPLWSIIFFLMLIILGVDSQVRIYVTGYDYSFPHVEGLSVLQQNTFKTFVIIDKMLITGISPFIETFLFNAPTSIDGGAYSFWLIRLFVRKSFSTGQIV